MVKKRADRLGWIIPPLKQVPFPVGFTDLAQKPRDKKHRDYDISMLDLQRLTMSPEQLELWKEYCIRYNET